MLQFADGRMDGGEKVGVRSLSHEFVVVIRHRDFDDIGVMLMGENDVGFRLAFPIIQQLPYLFELLCQFLRLGGRQLDVPSGIGHFHCFSRERGADE